MPEALQVSMSYTAVIHDTKMVKKYHRPAHVQLHFIDITTAVRLPSVPEGPPKVAVHILLSPLGSFQGFNSQRYDERFVWAGRFLVSQDAYGDYKRQ